MFRTRSVVLVWVLAWIWKDLLFGKSDDSADVTSKLTMESTELDSRHLIAVRQFNYDLDPDRYLW